MLAGSASVDGIKVAELSTFLRTAWLRLHRELWEGTYRSQPIRPTHDSQAP